LVKLDIFLLKDLLKFSLKDLISKTQIKQEKISKLYQLALELCPIYENKNKNKKQLTKTKLRKDILEILEEGLNAIQLESVLKNKISISNNYLTIDNQKFNLNNLKNRNYWIWKGKFRNCQILRKYFTKQNNWWSYH